MLNFKNFESPVVGVGISAFSEGVAADAACRAKCPEVAACGAEGGVFAERFCHL